MFGGMDVEVPEKRLKNGWRVSLNFVPEEGSTRGGPITTDGLIVLIANDGWKYSLALSNLYFDIREVSE